MSLNVPPLDERTFQDIVDELKQRIPFYCPEWTDHNVSDPGITLLELFAWVTESLLFRLNRVPDNYYARFMEFMGVTLKSPTAAKTPVSIWLSGPLSAPKALPSRIEVSTIQTDRSAPVVFTTTGAQEVVIYPPQLKTAVLGRETDSNHLRAYDGTDPNFSSEFLRKLEHGLGRTDVGWSIFSAELTDQDALYFGFDNNLSDHILRFTLDFGEARGTKSDPRFPPYAVEASSSDGDTGWIQCHVSTDTTDALNAEGLIDVHVPRVTRRDLAGSSLYWVRFRNRQPYDDDGTPAPRYEQSPQLRRLRSVHAIGITIPAIHAQTIENESLGASDGTPGQRFYLRHAPLLTPDEGSSYEIYSDVDDAIWSSVATFAQSKQNDRHFTVDYVNGEIRFGPVIRQPDGTQRAYGQTPARGAALTCIRYRHGGGHAGNVSAHALQALKSSIPFVARVDNLESAFGGRDAESLDEARMRLQREFVTRRRAVTAADYEHFALQFGQGRVARAACITPAAPTAVSSVVNLFIVPAAVEPAGYLTASDLELSPRLKASLWEQFQSVRMVAVQVNLSAPTYHRVSVAVELEPAPVHETDGRTDAVLRYLYRYLNPLVGGDDGTGWEFGRELTVADLNHGLRQFVPQARVRTLRLFRATEVGEPTGAEASSIPVGPTELIASGQHAVTIGGDPS